MSKPSLAHPLALRRLALVAIAALSTTACWEQMSVEWWPQMKWQKAVQAFEETGHEAADKTGGFMPPEGSVPVGAPLDLTALSVAESEALKNPTPPTLASLDNGKAQFAIYCTVCHGAEGHGDGPIAGPPFGTGPGGLVFPVGGPSSMIKAFSEGHLFTTMTLGRGRMPSYKRIPQSDRWDLVNYLLYMNDRVVPQTEAAAQAAAASAAESSDAGGSTE